MKTPLQITVRNVSVPGPLEEVIRQKVAKLEEFCDQIMGCRVLVDMPHRHHQHGNLYQVRIDLTVPGKEIVVNREPSAHVANRDPDVAVGDAFAAVARQLEDYVRQHRRLVKHHEPTPQARVARLFPKEDYGFLVTAEGREIFFHRNSLLHGDFEHLQVGTAVTFAEEEGAKGPQASTVKILGHH